MLHLILVGLPEEQRKIGRAGITIGRGPGCDWTLTDPGRYLSRVHCAIEFSDGSYFITDSSTNGVFLNRATQPLGPNSREVLRNGDRIELGLHSIEVHIAEDGVAVADASSVRPSKTGSTSNKHQNAFGLYTGMPPARSSTPADVPTRTGQPETVKDTYPSPALREDWPDVPDFSSEGAPYASSPQSFLIPDDDFIADLRMDSARPIEDTVAERTLRLPSRAEPPGGRRPVSIAPPFAAPVTSVPKLPPGSGEVPSAAADQSVFGSADTALSRGTVPKPAPERLADPSMLGAFLGGAGLRGTPGMASEDPERILEAAGRALRSMARGLRQVLLARATLKNTFRIKGTSIASADNNPLKFAAGEDEMMLALLLPTKPGYLGPEAAVTEAMEDVKAHLVATAAGMQAGIDALLRQTSPESVTRQQRQSPLERICPMVRKARCWDLYESLHARLASGDAADSFSIHNRAFAKAYEDQMQALSTEAGGPPPTR